MQIPERLLEFTLAIAMNKQPESYGIPYLRFIVNVQLLTLIFGQLTQQYFLVNVIELWEKRTRPRAADVMPLWYRRKGMRAKQKRGKQAT
jgi:hypothetical protein